MKILVDTHAFFWWLRKHEKLSQRALDALEDPANEIVLSAVVAWELAAKNRIGKWPEAEAILRDLDWTIATNGFRPLSISIAHARLAGQMRGEHRDPFDRMLAAQASIEQAPLVTRDSEFREFGVETLW